MEPRVTFCPIKILTGNADEQGVLVLANDDLAAVLVRLSPAVHEEDVAGRWFLETAFGRCVPNKRIFDDLESANRWFRKRLSHQN